MDEFHYLKYSCNTPFMTRQHQDDLKDAAPLVMLIRKENKNMGK